MLESHTKVPINRVPHPRQERALTPFLVHLHSAHAPSGAWYFAVLAAFRPFGVSALIGIAIAIEPPDGSWGRGRRPQGAAPQGPRPAKGHVVDAQCASDADLDAARALLPRRSTFPGDALPAGGAAHRRRHHGGGDVDAGGSRILVAGPWATAFPYSVNPSYFSPRTFALLADASGQSGWQALTTSSYAVVRSLTSGGPALPPDWTVLDAAGTAHPSAAAGDWPQRRGRFSGLPA